ncbi:GNAT family N-acetyltransferase [Candidatus Woesearchaeota archaeon]|nr:GNAT family N-acetyltransferase [Candidatus Woesearchaeota archaeon]
MKLGIKGIFLFLIGTIIALSQELPQPTGYVNDFARILSPATIGILDERIEALREKNSVEIAVVTIQSTGELPIEDYANLLFQKWGIGQRGADNGVLILVAVKDRKVRIEPGYGLEPILPDGLCGEIVRNRILPEFRKGDFEEEVKSIEKIMNDAMVRSHHYQFVPIGLKEFLFFAEELKEFFDPELIWFIEYRGKPNGVCVVYPDVNVALQKFHGKIGIREWAEWLFLKRKIKKARLEFIALEPILQHKGLGFALVSTAISKLIEKGYTHLEYSWVIETNKKSNHLAKIFGGKLYKRYRIFEKRLKKRQFSGLNNFGLKR